MYIGLKCLSESKVFNGLGKQPERDEAWFPQLDITLKAWGQAILPVNASPSMPSRTVEVLGHLPQKTINPQRKALMDLWRNDWRCLCLHQW